MVRFLGCFFLIICIGKLANGQYTGLQKQIPNNFSILDSASGDFNKDGFKDYILILKNKYEKLSFDTTRPLLILFGNKDEQFKLAARNDSVVLCLNCGGIFGDPYAAITINKEFFSIEHYGGSNWRWTRIITFKYDSKRKIFLLRRDAGLSWHISDPDKQTEILHNKEDFGRVSFAEYSNQKEW